MNEEEMKVLEKLVNKKYTRILLEIVSVFTEKDNVFVLSEKERQAIKSLIKRNKELEEKEKNLLKQLKDSEKELLEVTQNVISKSKIKEEIKKLKENNGVSFDLYTGRIVKTEEDYKIAILKKLLRSK